MSDREQEPPRSDRILPGIRRAGAGPTAHEHRVDRSAGVPGKTTLVQRLQGTIQRAATAVAVTGEAHAPSSSPDDALPLGEAYHPPPPMPGPVFDTHALHMSSVQRAAEAAALGIDDPDIVHAHAARGVSGPATALPHGDVIQRAFGPDHDLSGVQAHVGGPAADASEAIGATAYAAGNHIAFARAPDLHTAAHEAAHYIQQRAGVSLKGGVGQSGDPYEQHADAVANAVVAGRDASTLLGVPSKPSPSNRAWSPEIQRRQAPSRPRGTLVANVLAAIDASARRGLDALDKDDLAAATGAAQQAVLRIDHLLSITAVPGGGSPVAGADRDAGIALGRTAALASALRGRSALTAAALEHMLTRVEIEIAPAANWAWKPEAEGRKAGDGLTRREGIAIGVDTLAIVRRRAEAVLGAREAAPVLVAAAAIADDLRHVNRELGLALRPGHEGDYVDEVLATGKLLARLEAIAYQHSEGMSQPLERMRAAETELRTKVGLKSERVIFETALPAMTAIIDIVHSSVEVRDGIGYDLSQPSAHRAKVPARYLPLLDQWFQVTHGRVQHANSTVTTTRGRTLATELDRALIATMPLIHALHNEGDPTQVEPWLERFFTKVSEFRARAISETVSDHINDKADKALAADDSAIDHLDEETQIKIASQQLYSIARQGVSVAQRLASSEKAVAQSAIDAFRDNLKKSDLPQYVHARLATASTVAEVAQHIAGFANGIQAVMTLSDNELRMQMLQKEFGVNRAAGATQVTKQLLWLVQGGLSSYSLLSAGLLAAKGQGGAARQILAASGKTIGKLSVALNAVGAAHGLVMVIYGSGTAKLDGAVEATWGTVGLAGRFAPRLARFTGPLSAAIAITHLTVKGLGNLAVGSLYGMIQIGLNMVYNDMHRTAEEVHTTAMRLAVALESGDELTGQDLERELTRKADALRWNLREMQLRPYIDRTKRPGTNSDPGTYRPLRERFKLISDLPMSTDIELLTTAETFLSVVVYCFQDAQQVLEEAVAASVERHA